MVRRMVTAGNAIWPGVAVMLELLDKRSQGRVPQLCGLTVGDVIAMLETFDPSAPLLVRGENGGFAEVLGFRATGVALNVNSAEGFGPHDLPDSGQRADTVAVVLRAAD
jgi:hypothetical protein